MEKLEEKVNKKFPGHKLMTGLDYTYDFMIAIGAGAALGIVYHGDSPLPKSDVGPVLVSQLMAVGGLMGRYFSYMARNQMERNHSESIFDNK
jgi:hypothetical protein